jgi:hypothetical protein
MNKRQYLLLRGWAYVLTTIILLTIFVTQKIDGIGIIFGIAILSFLSYKSYSCFKELNNTSDEEQVFAPSTDSSVREKISFYKRMVLIAIPAFIILSVWTYLDLKSLESGAVAYVSLWGPISLLYNLGGYWLALLTTPVLGIIIVTLLLRKIVVTKQL